MPDRDAVDALTAPAGPASTTDGRYDSPDQRRRCVAQARARAQQLRAVAATGEQATATSAWPERARAATEACRTLADHPTDPVARALVAGLTADDASPAAAGDAQVPVGRPDRHERIRTHGA
jgi:hypothetical protein